MNHPVRDTRSNKKSGIAKVSYLVPIFIIYSIMHLPDQSKLNSKLNWFFFLSFLQKYNFKFHIFLDISRNVNIFRICQQRVVIKNPTAQASVFSHIQCE